MQEDRHLAPTPCSIPYLLRTCIDVEQRLQWGCTHAKQEKHGPQGQLAPNHPQEETSLEHRTHLPVRNAGGTLLHLGCISDGAARGYSV